MAETINLKTSQRTEFVDITHEVQAIIGKKKVKSGVVHLYVPHTTAGITINENADPNVRVDIINQLNKLIPHSGSYQHTEGNADAHIKSTLTGISLSVPIDNGQLVLGTWQGIFFCEFDGPRTRKVYLAILPSGTAL